MREFTSWIAFNNLSPISDERGDYQAAQITEMIYSANRGKDSPKINIEDFKLFKQKTKQDLIVDQLDPLEREFYNSFNK